MKVLCLDGGGVRGVASAQFLYRLESALLERTGKGVLETFDFFAGTSAGALCIGCLVYAKMSCYDVVEKILTQRTLRKMMNQSWWDRMVGLVQVRPKYDGKGKTEVILDVVGKEATLWDTDKKVMITAFDADTRQPVFYKSYEKRKRNLAKALDASSAAPAYFPAIDGRLVDGAIAANNPSDCALADIVRYFETDPEDVVVISVGTGRSPHVDAKRNWGGISWALKGDLFGMVMDGPPHAVDYRMRTTMGERYVRVNGPCADSSLDNTSASNLDALRKMGDEWFDEFGEKVLAQILKHDEITS